MFLESIKFYEHVDVMANVFEALSGNPALDHDNNIHEVTYHEYQGMFDIALFLKKNRQGSTMKFKDIVQR